MKKFHAVLLLLGVSFLGWLVWKLGVRELWRELGQLGWGVGPLILLEGVGEAIHTIGWRHCLGGPLRQLPWGRLFRIRMAGYAINYVTPTAALGGEVTKAALLASHHRGAEAVSGVLIEKVCFALSHLLFVVVGAAVVVWRIPLPRPMFVGMLSGSVLLAAGIVTFLLLQKHGKLGVLVRWLAARRIGGAVLQRAAGGVTEVDEALKRYYRERPLDLALAIAWHLLGFSVGIVQTWLFFRFMDRDASLAMSTGAWFIGMCFDLLTFAVPMNLGALEGSRIVALRAVGYDALLGMTYGVALRLALLFWVGVGLVNYALLVSQIRGTDMKPGATATSRAGYRRAR